jgi:bifunctional non-homologous end joining protein LigD
MLLTQVRRPFTADGWTFELKYDGWRCLAEVNAGKVRLQSRRGNDASRWWPEVAQSFSTLGGHHIFDGEVCVLDDLGRSDFDRLQKRSMLKGWKPGADAVVYCVFDVLIADGVSAMSAPLEDRKRGLAEILDAPRPSVMLVGHLEREGEWLYQRAVDLQLEGIVAKRLDSCYAPGLRSADWLKIKRPGAVPPERFKHPSVILAA